FMALRLNDIDLVSSLEPSSLTGRDHRVRLQLCCFLCRLLLFFARLGCRLSLRAGLLQALLQDGNEIDFFGWLGRFLWFFLYLFSARFDFLFDNFHERIAIIVAI